MTVVARCRRGPNGTPCGKASRSPTLAAGDCPRCWANQYTREELAALRPAPAERSASPAPTRGVCLHLGHQLSAFDRPKCQRLYVCEKGHGTAAGVCPSRDCRSCPDHEPEAPPA